MPKERSHKPDHNKEAVKLALEAGTLITLGAMARWLVHKRIRGADEDDLLQDTAERALKYKDSFRGESSVKTWLGGVMKHRAQDLADAERAQKRSGEEMSVDVEQLEAQIVDSTDSPEQALMVKEKLQEALGPMSPLTMNERIAMLLQIHGYSFAEMSQMLGEPEGTLKARINRGRAKLKEAGINPDLYLAA